MHKLLRLTRSLHNKPLLVNEETLSSVMQVLEQRNAGMFIEQELELQKYKDKRKHKSEGGVGVIQVEGPLTYKSTGWEALCGGASYEGMLDQFAELVDEGVDTVVLNQDSGGGEAYGMMEFAERIRELADENEVRIVSYVDGISASASYGISAVADEIIVNPQAQVGSIGVVVRLMNDSKALEDKGYQRTFVHAGANKVPYDTEGNFSEAFINELQASVDEMYEEFTGHVAKYRDMSVEKVKGTEAGMFSAKAALELGLADKVMTRKEFVEYLADRPAYNKPVNQIKFENEGNIMTLKELQAQLAEVQAGKETLEAEFAGKVAELEASAGVIEGLKSELSEAQCKVTELTQVTEELQKTITDKVEAEKQAIADSRKAELITLLGDVQGEAVFTAIGGLEEVAYEAAMTGYRALADKEDQKEQEIGFNGAKQEESSVRTIASVLKKN